MLGFSFTEILLLAVIALVVIGPKQLPEVARNLGRFLNELKRTSNSFSREFRENMDQAKIDPIKFDTPAAHQTPASHEPGPAHQATSPHNPSAETPFTPNHPHPTAGYSHTPDSLSPTPVPGHAPLPGAAPLFPLAGNDKKEDGSHD